MSLLTCFPQLVPLVGLLRWNSVSVEKLIAEPPENIIGFHLE